MLLNKPEIKKRILSQGLIQDYLNLDIQLTPNGFDLTAGCVFEFDTAGALDFSNNERVIPAGKELTPKKNAPKDKFGWWKLQKGTYKIKTNETVNLANDLIALAFSRTSLLRMGCFTQHGVWDAGFKGKGEFVLIVDNPEGVSLKQNARIAQLIFLPINEIDKGYSGIYQNKG
jgi:dUTP pyrophosphatase